eukprot:jgi/Bigna1/87487/estExt_fgenesh1_pg.C_210008
MTTEVKGGDLKTDSKDEGLRRTGSRVSIGTAKEALIATAFKSLEKCEDTGTVAKSQLVEVLNRFTDSSDTQNQSGIRARDMSFRSLLEHPEAGDGLDGVDIRDPSSPVIELTEGVRTRLVSQLKAIEDHIKNSDNLAHLCKITRKLDVVLEVCGIHAIEVDKKMEQLKKPKSFVDIKRFMHVGGSDLIFFCDTTGESEGVNAVDGAENINAMLQERLGEMKMDEQSQIAQGSANTKQIARKGFHPSMRPKMWRMIAIGEEFDSQAKQAEFEAIEEEIWHGHVPDFDELEHHVHVPDFGGPHKLFHSHPITEQGEAAVERLLCMLQHIHPEVVYCPFLPDLCSILVLHVPEWEVYHMIDAMIERSKKDEWFFPLSGERFMCYVESFLLLMQVRNKILAKHIEKLGINMIHEVEVWFARLYVSFVSYDTVLRITDCFISEGAKMLFRIGLALLKLHEKELLACSSKHQFLKRFAKRMRMHTNIDDVLAEAFSIRGFSRRMLSKLHATHEIQDIPFAKVPVFYMPQFTASSSKLLTVTQLRKLWKHLPALMRIQDPVLLFTTETHGYSLDILLDRTGHQSAFIIIKTNKQSSFGVFLHWREDLRKHEIGEESFVFTLSPKLQCYHYYYSDPKRWGDTKKGGTSSASPAQKPPALIKAQSDARALEPEKLRLPDLQRAHSTQAPTTPTKQQQEQQSNSQSNSTRRRMRRSSEKVSSRTTTELRDDRDQNREETYSAPSSPIRQVSEELYRQIEEKQTKPKDALGWRTRKQDEKRKADMEAAALSQQQNQKTSMVAPTQAALGRGKSFESMRLRNMDTLNGNVVNLWCRRTPQWFGIGSGDRVALGIDHRLHHGVTESTIAFNNPPLNGEKYHGDFKCVALEVWGLTH